ncbi:MAG TPA: hypothetical protein VGA99_15645, partial [bacterium]
ESIVRQFYNDAVSAMGRGDQASALAALEKVRHLHPQFKDAESLITKLESELKSEPVAADSTLASYYKSLHEDAVKALNNENWLQAVLRLEKLRVLKPDDQDVMKLLAHARANLKLAPSANAANARSKYSSRVYLAGACVALVMVPLLGFWFFSATSRARFQFLRGNYVRASQIYERLLSQHPEKVKLYIKLANIYLISGRDDDRAFRVFKTIVNLNLAPHIHPQINSVLAQRYLTNGTSNPDAIAVLENALKTEQSKENNL